MTDLTPVKSAPCARGIILARNAGEDVLVREHRLLLGRTMVLILSIVEFIRILAVIALKAWKLTAVFAQCLVQNHHGA